MPRKPRISWGSPEIMQFPRLPQCIWKALVGPSHQGNPGLSPIPGFPRLSWGCPQVASGSLSYWLETLSSISFHSMITWWVPIIQGGWGHWNPHRVITHGWLLKRPGLYHKLSSFDTWYFIYRITFTTVAYDILFMFPFSPGSETV